MKKYIVKLTQQEREALNQLISHGKHAARKLLYARILLKALTSEEGPAWHDEEICNAFETSLATVFRIRQRGGGIRHGSCLDEAFGAWTTSAKAGWLLRSATHYFGLQFPTRGAEAVDNSVARPQNGGIRVYR